MTSLLDEFPDAVESAAILQAISGLSRTDHLAVDNQRSARIQVLDPPRRDGSGNAVLLFTEDSKRRVLKVYRSRTSRPGEQIANLVTVHFQRKRGVDPFSRFDTERRTLDVWARHGFDVFRVRNEVSPEGLGSPSTWMDYCEGRRLDRLLLDPTTKSSVVQELLFRIAGEMSRRHALAIDLREPLLCHVNGHAKHVLVQKDRFITFDFESAWRAGFPILEALSHELGTFVRSVYRAAGENGGGAISAFLSGYRNDTLLMEIVDCGLHGRSLLQIMRRTRDRIVRGKAGKTHALRLLRDQAISSKTHSEGSGSIALDHMAEWETMQSRGNS